MTSRANDHISPAGATVIPTVRYRDVSAGVAWLQEAFGFAPHRLVRDRTGTIVYAELTFGSGMIMVAPVQDSPLGRLMVQPDEIGGAETQICYLYVPDPRRHAARAKAAGAEIVLDMEPEAKGSRGYSCRDPEGHVWNFGTHDPWRVRNDSDTARPKSRRKYAVAACVLLAAAAVYMHEPARDLAVSIAGEVSASIDPARAEHAPDEGPLAHTLRDMREQLSKERLARLAADRHAKDIEEELLRERRAREEAELAGKAAVRPEAPQAHPAAAAKLAELAAAEARAELAKARQALQAASQQLADAQKAREAAERSATEVRQQLTRLRDDSEASERAAHEARELAVRERSRRIKAERILRLAKTSPYTPYPLE